MVIDIEPICNCGCQADEDRDIAETFACNDPKCNYNGKLVCGACICCGDYFGPDCTCKNGSLVDPLNPLMNCRKPYTVIKDDNTTVIRYEHQICSGKGQCDECGNCICQQEREGVIIYGPYCDKVFLLKYYVRKYRVLVCMKTTQLQICSSVDFRFVITRHVNATSTGDYVVDVVYATAESVIASPANLGTQI